MALMAFLFNLAPGHLPSGRILDSVLIEVRSNYVRLEGISMVEPSVWLRRHTICCEGQVVPRQAGQPVGQLGSTWRALSRQPPAFFAVGVCVWMQPQCNEDEVICNFLSELSLEEAVLSNI